MNCATGKGVTVKAKDKRYPTREIRKTTSGTRISSGYEIAEALVRLQQQQQQHLLMT